LSVPGAARAAPIRSAAVLKPERGCVTRISCPQLVSPTGCRSRTGSKLICGYRLRFITSVFTLTSSVLPSGAARTTASVPMLPEAPARLSTTTGRLRRSDRRGPSVRAIKSMPVPGVKGTISRSGPSLGWAAATPAVLSSKAAIRRRRTGEIRWAMNRLQSLACYLLWAPRAPPSSVESRVFAAHTMNLDELYQRPGFLLRRTHQISAAVFESACAEVGLTPAQYGVLTVLAAEPGLDQTRLARALAFDKVTVMRVLKGL